MPPLPGFEVDLRRAKRRSGPGRAALVAWSLIIGGHAATAEPRFQAITVGPGYEFGSEKVLILDTESGHLWIWLESPATDEAPGGRYLIYQGQARPGRAVGEVIGKQEWRPGR